MKNLKSIWYQFLQSKKRGIYVRGSRYNIYHNILAIFSHMYVIFSHMSAIFFKMSFCITKILYFNNDLHYWNANFVMVECGLHYLNSFADNFLTPARSNCQFLCSRVHPDRKELIKIISTRYLLISLITRKYLVDMILINLSGRDVLWSEPTKIGQ
jgi:hypothetical protein